MITSKDGVVAVSGVMLELLADLGAAAAAIRNELKDGIADEDGANEIVMRAVYIALMEEGLSDE